MTDADFYGFEAALGAEQRAVRDRVRAWARERVLPIISDCWERAECPLERFTELRELGVLGGMRAGDGCAGLDALSWGLTRYELARVDGSLATFYGVHSGLAMGSIGRFGDAEQRARWLPAMARLEQLGAFALSEPERGSDAAGLQARAVADGDGWRLSGHKRWIGNAPFAQLMIVWARDEQGALGGFVIEDPREQAGVNIETITGKAAKRAIANGDVRLEDVFVPGDQRLREVSRFGQLAELLTETRYTIAWETAGIARACLELAREHAKAREQFGGPIARFQLVQGLLVEMAAETMALECLCLRMAEQLAAGQLSAGAIAMAKAHGSRVARRVAASARELLGAEGVLIDRHVARLLLDAEAAATYEGTAQINTLIAGRELLGVGAFS